MFRDFLYSFRLIRKAPLFSLYVIAPLALGAQNGDVLRLLSSRPLRFASLGVILGATGFYAAAPAFRSVLYEVPPADPITMGGAAVVVLAITMAATLVAVW